MGEDMADVGGHEYLRTHTLQAEHLLLDLEAAARDLRSFDEAQDRRAVTLVRQSGLNVVLVHLRAGAALEEHAAPGPVTVSVLDGHVEVMLGGESFDAPGRRLVAFDAGVRHSVRAIDDSTLLLTIAAAPPSALER